MKDEIDEEEAEAREWDRNVSGAHEELPKSALGAQD